MSSTATGMLHSENGFLEPRRRPAGVKHCRPQSTGRCRRHNRREEGRSHKEINKRINEGRRPSCRVALAMLRLTPSEHHTRKERKCGSAGILGKGFKQDAEHSIHVAPNCKKTDASQSIFFAQYIIHVIITNTNNKLKPSGYAYIII